MKHVLIILTLFLIYSCLNERAGIEVLSYKTIDSLNQVLVKVIIKDESMSNQQLSNQVDDAFDKACAWRSEFKPSADVLVYIYKDSASIVKDSWFAMKSKTGVQYTSSLRAYDLSAK
jgi:hypothetical protein